jgi:hypothetical protein
MNDKILFVISCILAVALAIWTVFAKPEGLLLLVSIQLVVIILLIGGVVWFFQSKNKLLRRMGLKKVYERRKKATDKEYEFVSGANRSLVFVGIMHRSLWNYREQLEKALLSISDRNVEVKFYLSSPESPELRRRAADEADLADDWPEQIRLQISRFKHFKERYPTFNLSVFTYDAYPVWHIILRDDSRALVGWYPLGHTGYDAPLYEVTRDPHSSLFAPIELWLRSLERSATQVL